MPRVSRGLSVQTLDLRCEFVLLNACPRFFQKQRLITCRGDIFSVGLSVGWGIAKYSGTSLSATVTCPDNVSCGLTAQPLMLEVKGLYTAYLCGSQFSADKTYPCTNFAPPWCPRTVFNATIGQSYAYTAVCAS